MMRRRDGLKDLVGAVGEPAEDQAAVLLLAGDRGGEEKILGGVAIHDAIGHEALDGGFPGISLTERAEARIDEPVDIVELLLCRPMMSTSALMSRVPTHVLTPCPR